MTEQKEKDLVFKLFNKGKGILFIRKALRLSKANIEYDIEEVNNLIDSLDLHRKTRFTKAEFIQIIKDNF